jgi:DNA repair protein SbcD/Mre11
VRIVHLADTHLGFRQFHRTDDRGRNIRELDVYGAFDAAVERAIELRPAAVIHAGDLFDSYHPSSAALAVALDGIARLSEAGIPFVVIAGNHSTPRAASAEHVFGVLERFDRSGLVHAVHGGPAVVRIGGLAVHAVPHHNSRDGLAEQLRAARPLADADFNVCVVHMGLGGMGNVGAAEAGSLTLSGEELEAVGDFDYIALGHLHKADRVRINAAYSGSLERLTWADDAREKGIAEIDLAAAPLDDGYYVRHPIPARRRVLLDPIDAARTEDLTVAVVAAAERDDLDGAIARLTVRNATTAAAGGIDRRAVDEAFRACLHFELEVEPAVSEREGVTALAPLELRDFLTGRAPAGLDVAEFVTRAEGYLERAAEELAG